MGRLFNVFLKFITMNSEPVLITMLTIIANVYFKYLSFTATIALRPRVFLKGFWNWGRRMTVGQVKMPQILLFSTR